MNDLIAKLPARVKVGSFTFAIHLVQSGAPDLGENYGMTFFDDCRILLDGESTLDRFVNTLIHEIGHAVNHSYGIADGAEEEETIACQSANGGCR